MPCWRLGPWPRTWEQSPEGRGQCLTGTWPCALSSSGQQGGRGLLSVSLPTSSLMALPSYEVQYADPHTLQAGNGNIVAPDHDPGARWSWDLISGLSVQHGLPWAPIPCPQERNNQSDECRSLGLLYPEPTSKGSRERDRRSGHRRGPSGGAEPAPCSEGPPPQSQHGAHQPGWAHGGARACAGSLCPPSPPPPPGRSESLQGLIHWADFC